MRIENKRLLLVETCVLLELYEVTLEYFLDLEWAALTG